MSVITRFAPSPTGFLHIGGARTALFNYLFAKHNGGTFRLRIEDTDKERSSQEAVDAILDSMHWLGLDVDDDVVYQSGRQERHQEVVQQLLDDGQAYKCYCTPEELTEMRAAAQAENKGFKYDKRWRDKTVADAPEGVAPSIRIKAPLEGNIITRDLVQGDVKTDASELDDLVIMRSDGTPTYMLAVVVDDHDMGVTHIIRGDDHLTNSGRQQVIYDALGWDAPIFAHIPLIHGADGAKLSKRHGALGAEQYRDMGFLPEAINNYLLRLGWAHGDDEIISREQAIEWFDTKGIGKAASRFDLAKLEHLNGHYIKHAENARLAELVQPRLEVTLNKELSQNDTALLTSALEGLKQRVKNLNELAENAEFYFKESITPDEKSAAILNDGGREVLSAMIPALASATNWTHDALFPLLKDAGEKIDMKLGKVMAPFRAAITGSTASPSMFEVMELLGREETLKRLNAALEGKGVAA